MTKFEEIYSGLLNRINEDGSVTATPTSTVITPTTGTTPSPAATSTPVPTTTAATANHALVTQIATMKDPAAIATLLQKNNVLLPINPTE